MRGIMRGVQRSMQYVVVGLALVGVFAGAAHAVVYGQYYDYVTKINVGDDGYLYINVSGNFSNSHGCSQPWFARSAYPLGDDHTKAWLQQATASLLSHTKVYVQTNGCTASNYPIMNLLQLERP